MALTNPEITDEWTPIVAAGDEFTLAFPVGPSVRVEIAPTDANAAPSAGLIGLPVLSYQREAVTRALTGPGYIWARIAAGQDVETVDAILCAWTPS